MTAFSETVSPFELTEWPDDRQQTVTDFVGLLNVLSPGERDPNQVDAQVDRVISSPSTKLLVQQDAGRIVSTVTLNVCPILSGEGSRAWIDDVATMPEAQGKGYSKALMDEAERLAAPYGSVFLTSAAHRGVARSAYERRGYKLLNEADDPQVVFRSTTIGKGEGSADELFVEELKEHFHHTDIGDLSRLLGVDPYRISQRMRAAVESPTTKTFLVRALNGEIIGSATGNETPIPVGKKPWIDDIAGVDGETARMATEAAGYWLGKRYKHVNIVAPPDAEFGNDFAVRNSGLYMKRLGGIAAA